MFLNKKFFPPELHRNRIFFKKKSHKLTYIINFNGILRKCTINTITRSASKSCAGIDDSSLVSSKASCFECECKGGILPTVFLELFGFLGISYF